MEGAGMDTDLYQRRDLCFGGESSEEPCWPGSWASAALPKLSPRRLPAGEATGAASTTIEALMFSLRSRGEEVLREPDTRHRVAALSPEQLRDLIARLIRLRPLSPDFRQPASRSRRVPLL
jgi:hypothetical protein